MISSSEAIQYDDLTERTNNFLKYIVEPIIKESAKFGNRWVDILIFDKFINLSLYERIFYADKSLINKYFIEYDTCYSNELMFYSTNKQIIKNRLNFEISSLGYNIVFRDVKHDKINDGFSIIISW
jgi:hypothetical protein